MYKYGVLFGDNHSYRDWGLVTKARPVIGSPEPKTIYIDIPEADGQLDLTESLTGEVKFKNRSITCEFIVLEARTKWTSIYSKVMNYLHGHKLKVIFDEDPNHYYLGRFKVDEWSSNKKTSTLVISGEAEPYKYEVSNSLEPWEWDIFNFEDDYIREYANLEVNGELDFTVYGSRKSVVPTFIVTTDDGVGLQLVFEGEAYNLPDGANKIINVTIRDGEHHLKFIGHGTISIKYQGGSL